MNRPIAHTVRIGATAGGVVAGLMLLATTGQTVDGFVHAGFTGPLGLFGTTAADSQGGVLAIGDGSGDAGELAALLNSAAPADTGPDSGYRVAYEPGAAPNTAGLTIVDSPGALGAPVTKQSSPPMTSKPLVDAQGKVDCTGAISCHTDPNTRVTRVTYPDGIVAMVQQVNDMTVIAYETVTNSLPEQLQSLLPQAPKPAAAVGPTAPTAPAPATPATSAPVDPADPIVVAPERTGIAGPAAPPELSASGIRRSAGAGPATAAPGRPVPRPTPGANLLPLPGSPLGIGGTLDTVKGAVDSVVKAVTGAVEGAFKGPQN